MRRLSACMPTTPPATSSSTWSGRRRTSSTSWPARASGSSRRGSTGPGERPPPGPGFVASGGYTLASATPDGLELKANPRYWAGPPAIVDDRPDRGPRRQGLRGRIRGGRSRLRAGRRHRRDMAGLRQDAGPAASLGRLAVGPSTTASTRAQTPFDDARVRQAFGEAVDWRRMAALGDSADASQVANSMVPPGIPGRSDADFVPTTTRPTRDAAGRGRLPGRCRLPAPRS